MSPTIVIGDCSLYLGDCTQVLPRLEEEIDALLFDPPYEFETSGGGKMRKARPNMDDIQAAGLNKGFDYSVIDVQQVKSVAVFCHNDQLATLVPCLNDQFGRYAVCAWHKSNPQPFANKHYVPDTEFYVHAWRAGGHPLGTIAQKARYWLGPVGKQDEYDHPTVKPIGLMRKVVRNVNGAVICDPYCGTGTTLAAALIEGRRGIGIETNPAYFAMAVKRLQRVYSDGLVRRRIAA